MKLKMLIADFRITQLNKVLCVACPLLTTAIIVVLSKLVLDGKTKQINKVPYLTTTSLPVVCCSLAFSRK